MRRVSVAVVCLVLVAGASTGCTANPPPPPASTDVPVTTTAVAALSGDPVVVAIDDVGIGFNPHLLSDQSPANAAVSSLVLPSPFRPVVLDPANPNVVTWNLDPSVLISAEMATKAPFTITYQLRNEAQWSDSAPVAAEDFRYLWQEMITAPGVVDPAGYRLIDNVESSGGGKTVTVTMKSAYPAWRQLFTDLLPSHLLKDSPGGFARGLGENVPVSAGRFKIKSLDQGRDEILLERNDRFWDEPAKPDRILLRRGGSSDQLADSIRSGDAQVAQVRGGTATQAQLSAIPAVRTGTIFQPRVLDFTLNGRVPMLTNENVRRGILGLLDPNLLGTVASGSGSGHQPVRAQLTSPSDPGYAATAPAGLSREQSVALLVGAGYVSDAIPATAESPAVGGPLLLGGKQVTFVIGTPDNDDVAAAVASTAVDELKNAGIDASVKSFPADELYGRSLTTGAVDAVIGWTRAGSDAATALASRFSCPPVLGTSSAETVSAYAAAPSNLSGLCVPDMQENIQRAITGTGNAADIAAESEAALWELGAVLPIMQDSSVVAAGPGVQDVSLSGPIQDGIFGDAASWVRRSE